MDPDLAQRIVAVLVADSSSLRAQGLNIAVDFLFAQKVRELVDVQQAQAIVLDALTAPNVQRILDRHVKPGWRRYSETVSKTTEPLGILVPDPSREKIREVVAKSRLPRAKWAQSAVEPALLRKLFAPVFAHVLLSFAKKLPVVGGAASGATSPGGGGKKSSGLAERLSRQVQKSAERVVDAGRNVMGGLGAEVERRMQSTARDFSEAAMGMWRDALRERLRTKEGRDLMAQISQQATDHVLMTKIMDLHEDALHFPVEAALDVSPSLIEHGAKHAFVRRIVDSEVSAFIELEGDRTLKEVLAELGIEASVRAAVERQLDGLARGFLGSDAFSAWLTRVLQASAKPT